MAYSQNHSCGKNSTAHGCIRIIRKQISYSKSTNTLYHDVSRSLFQLSNLLWMHRSQFLHRFCQSCQKMLLQIQPYLLFLFQQHIGRSNRNFRLASSLRHPTHKYSKALISQPFAECWILQKPSKIFLLLKYYLQHFSLFFFFGLEKLLQLL